MKNRLLLRDYLTAALQAAAIRCQARPNKADQLGRINAELDRRKRDQQSRLSAAQLSAAWDKYLYD